MGVNNGNWHRYCYVQDRMQGGNKKAKSRSSKRGKGRPGRPSLIDEYNFFLAPNEEAPEEGVPEGNAKKKENERPEQEHDFFSFGIESLYGCGHRILLCKSVDRPGII